MVKQNEGLRERPMFTSGHLPAVDDNDDMRPRSIYCFNITGSLLRDTPIAVTHDLINTSNNVFVQVHIKFNYNFLAKLWMLYHQQ